MALTNLTSLTQSQYNSLSLAPISPPPHVSSTGSPDRNAVISLGGWTPSGDLAFIVNDPQNTTLNIDPALTNTLVIGIPAGAAGTPQNTYWTVSLGASGGDWSVSFQVNDGKNDTGTWVFTKGKGFDDDFINKRP